MNTKPATTPYTVRLRADVKEALEAQAAREDRPASQLAAQAVSAMLVRKQAERTMIEAAIVEADKGEFISDEAMTRWVMSWDTDNELPEPTADIKT